MPKHPERRLESWKKYNAKRRGDPEYQKKEREYQKRYWQEHKDDKELKKIRAARMRRYTKDPTLRIRHEARWKLGRKIASGKILKKPCEKCGNTKVEAHHHDYEKPYDVIWLCRECHRNEHAQATKEE